MGLPAYIPAPSIVGKLPAGQDVTLRELCDRAGVVCRVTGISAERSLKISCTKSLEAARLPGLLGPVWLGVPKGSLRRRALLALGLLAYGVFDYAARETLRGLSCSRASVGAGRPRTGKALTGAERQRRWRQRIEHLLV
jgi:hypothetical protein